MKREEYESEETEVKNMRWLKEETQKRVDKLPRAYRGLYIEGSRDAYHLTLQDINQLNEPEVLSQELPVIPKFVADWIEEVKERNKSLVFAITHIYNENEIGTSPSKEEKRLYQWFELYDNEEVFARAWLDGYEVEKEQKYILSINITDKASKTNYETFLNKRGIFHSMDNETFNSEEFNWSEEEIKGLENGKILFEHFATKVEELE